MEADEIELGFFSFGKFMIYHDLDSFEWPEENKPFEHPLLQNLFGNGFSEAAPGFTEDHQLDTETNAMIFSRFWMQIAHRCWLCSLCT